MDSAVELILEDLSKLGEEKYKSGMSRFAIPSDKAIGIRLPVLKSYAKPYRKQHELAIALWETAVHEARIMAAYIDDPKKVTPGQMESWTKDFDSWDICDQACMGLFVNTTYAYEKALEWSTRETTFEKRAGFAMMAAFAVHRKKEPDDVFKPFLEAIEREAHDDRNFVKKAVNWALRQIGKRNLSLNLQAIQTAQHIAQQPHKAARWIASDALRELNDPMQQERLIRKQM